MLEGSKEPLWAGPPADQRKRPKSLWADPQPEDLDDVVVRWERDEPEPPAPPPSTREPRRRRVPPLGVAAAIVAVALAATLPRGDGLVVTDVPSYWEDVTMTCRTARFEQGDRAFELFRCRAVGAGRLPPGVYRQPRSQWTSDISRHAARINEIEISTDGVLTGWAAY